METITQTNFEGAFEKQNITCYCNNTSQEKQYFKCIECERIVHFKCVKNPPPGGLDGDVFFQFTCYQCGKGIEIYTREKLQWITCIILVLYNLQNRFPGLSHKGYFHWKINICNFIGKHWNTLFGNTYLKRKKNWTGTVSGSLSHFNGIIFQSGTEELNESGWWRLSFQRLTPFEHISSNLIRRRYQQEKSSSSSSSISFFPSMSVKKDSDMYSRDYVEPTATLSRFLFADEDEDQSTSSSMVIDEVQEEINEEDLEVMDEEDIEYISNTVASDIEVDISGEIADLHDMLDLSDTTDFIDSDTLIDSLSPLNKGNESSGEDTSSNIQSLSPSNESQPSTSLGIQNSFLFSQLENRKHSPAEPQPGTSSSSTSTSSPPLETQQPIKKLREPLFKLRDKNENLFPWKEEECKPKTNPNKKYRPMTEYEELEIINKLKPKLKYCANDSKILRFYRKLVVRKEQRERGLPLFDLNEIVARITGKPMASSSIPSSPSTSFNEPKRILDRFLTGIRIIPYRIVETVEPRPFVSPYTQRTLKPFIRRDVETFPRWLKLTYELLSKVHKDEINWKPPYRYPIDFCYVRPHHIPAINSLLSEFFYPGIDVSECLDYPDFTCVCLYKKLLIGFACMVPDTGYNEAYISYIVVRPEWRNSKIGTFMIYHLIQTCLGKDITLHVSATNTAMILYQQFGFKSQEFIKNFYDKYLPYDSRESKHAFFLRLSR